MTVRTSALQTCDRCMKPFNEKHLKAGDAVPVFKQKGLVVTESKGTSKDKEPTLTVLFSFDDMCPDCVKAVDNLLAKVRLEGKKAPKKRRSRKKKEPKPKDTPPVETYSEGDKPQDTPPEKPEETPPEKPADEPPAEKPGPDGEPAKGEGEAEENQEAEAPSEPTAESSDIGEESEQDEDGLVEDPATGDKYDPTTGEVKVRGDKGPPEKHPF